MTNSRKETLDRVEDYIILVVAAIARGDWPLQLPIHGKDEMMTWRLAKQRRKCLLLFHLLAKSHALLRTNTSSTKRYFCSKIELPFLLKCIPSSISRPDFSSSSIILHLNPISSCVSMKGTQCFRFILRIILNFRLVTEGRSRDY